MPDAVGASSRGQGALEWRAFLFNAGMNCFASALATKRRNVQPVAMPLIPPSVRLGQCGDPCTCERLPHLLWDFALRNLVTNGDEQICGVAVIQEEFQMFVRAPTWSSGRAAG